MINECQNEIIFLSYIYANKYYIAKNKTTNLNSYTNMNLNINKNKNTIKIVLSFLLEKV